MRRCRRIGHWMLALFCIICIGLPAIATAMDREQIVQMSQMGLDDRAVMGAIDSAGDDLELDDADVDYLREQGVSDDIIAHLRRRGHVISDAPIDDEDDFDDHLGPAPAPADESEQERLEREEQERERQAEIERRAEELRQQQEAEQRRQIELERAAGRLSDARERV